MVILTAIVNIAILSLLAYILYRRPSSIKSVYWLALSFKLLAGIGVGLLYTYYYTTGDTFIFFKDGVTLAELAKYNFKEYLSVLASGDNSHAVWMKLYSVESRSLFLSKLISLFCLLTANNYWIIALYFSFISFVCSWKLVNTLIHYFPEAKQAAILSFLFVPSVIFWGSGILKECFSLAALFFLTSVFLKVWFAEKLKLMDLLLGLLFVWLLWQLKYYYAAIFLPVLLASLLVKFMMSYIPKLKDLKIEILIWFVVFSVPLFLVTFTSEIFHLDLFSDVVVKNYNLFQRYSAPGDAIQFNSLRASFVSILSNAPWALISGLFRPFIWEANEFLKIMASLENMVLLLLVITAAKHWKLVIQSPHKLLILSLIVYVVMLCVFLTLSTPNFGTLSRYRIAFVPFLFFIVSIRSPVIAYLCRGCLKSL